MRYLHTNVVEDGLASRLPTLSFMLKHSQCLHSKRYFPQLHQISADIIHLSVPSPYLIIIHLAKSFSFSKADTGTLPVAIRNLLPSHLQSQESIAWKELSKELQDQLWDNFNACLEALGDKVGVVLFQWMASFRPSEANKAYMLSCQRRLPKGVVMAVEFRSHHWYSPDKVQPPKDQPQQPQQPQRTHREDTIHFCKEHGIVLVACDEFLEGEYADEFTLKPQHLPQQPQQHIHPVKVDPHNPPPQQLPGFAKSSDLLRQQKTVKKEKEEQEEEEEEEMPKNVKEQKEEKEKESEAKETEKEKEKEKEKESEEKETETKVKTEGKWTLPKWEAEIPERTERMVPIVCAVTHPEIAYIRIHRRHGINRYLSQKEVRKWARRLRKMMAEMDRQQEEQTKKEGKGEKEEGAMEVRETGANEHNEQKKPKRIYLLFNTNFEDQSMKNMSMLNEQLGDCGMVPSLASHLILTNLMPITIKCLIGKEHSHRNWRHRRITLSDYSKRNRLSVRGRPLSRSTILPPHPLNRQRSRPS